MNIHSAVEKDVRIEKEKAAKPDIVLNAALDLIAQNGFHRTPMSLIAQKAGVGVGSIYRYFQDKDELIHGLHIHIIERARKSILKDYDGDLSIRERFFCLLPRIFLYLLANPKEFSFLEQYYNSPYGIPIRRERVLAESPVQGRKDALRELFEAGRNQHIFKDLPLSALFALSLGPIVFLVRDYNSGFVKLDEGMIRKTVQACWDAITC
jgi:AcrR family transcriptional regulator